MLLCFSNSQILKSSNAEKHCMECYQFLNTKILFDKQPSGTEFDIFMKFMFKCVYIHAVKRIVFYITTCIQNTTEIVVVVFLYNYKS